MFMQEATSREKADLRAVRSGTCELSPLAGGDYRLELAGKFPPRWLANLTSNLAAKDVNILRGEARKETPTLWKAVFELAPGEASALPAPEDFIAMTISEQFTPKAPEIRLIRYALSSSGAGFRVDIEGFDSVGFLVALFNRFTFFSLFPAEIKIDTPGGKIRDSFWLRGIGGTFPTEECRAAIDQELSKLVAC